MNTNENQSIPSFLKPVPIFSQCSDCEKNYPIEELSNLPETDKAYRMLALDKISIEEINAMELDINTLLCPQCLEKRKQELEDSNNQALQKNT